MPAMTNVLLRSDVDGTSDNTFLPVRDFPNPHWRTNVAGVPIRGQKRLEFQSDVLKSGKTKVNLKLVHPIMEVIPAGTVNSSGVQAGASVADDESVSVTFFLSARGTGDTRAELLRGLAHLCTGARDTSGTLIHPVTAGAHAYRDAAATSAIPYGIANLLFPGA